MMLIVRESCNKQYITSFPFYDINKYWPYVVVQLYSMDGQLEFVLKYLELSRGHFVPELN
ncbi:unnamed protein product [Schistosoma margrebowiei]|uniref:Uncharacterized protein n=1 Tax=Schistosoma margrebowiei TaxID=48269 RepID=A0A3P8DVV6_9TREM|nr:unnamed protein product [Schistosoma margrebowiei]